MSNKPLLKWTSHPLLDYPITSILLIVFLLLISTLFWKIAIHDWDQPLFFYLGFGALLGSLFPYFIPSSYEFYEDEIIIHYSFVKITKNYSEFKCFYNDKKGVMLSTFSVPRRLDHFRGQSIRFSKSKEEKVELFKILESKIGKSF